MIIETLKDEKELGGGKFIYDVAKNSDGGNLNIFNDSIKADEKFKVIENF